MSLVSLNRASVIYLTNKSGGTVAQGAVVIVDTANASAFTTTTTAGLSTSYTAVVLEPNGIANNAVGLVAFIGYTPKITLSAVGSIGDFVGTHTVAGQGARHAAPQQAGDFAQVFGTSATPEAVLFGPNPPALPAATGVAQIKNTQTGTVATGATVIPFDDTIPQNTEGDQYMSLAITPTSAANNLRIDVVGFFSPSAADWVTAALFRDATASAIACFSSFQATAAASAPSVFTCVVAAGSTAATTFKVRAGKTAGGTTTFNGVSGGRLFGGVFASSITITEYVP